MLHTPSRKMLIGATALAAGEGGAILAAADALARIFERGKRHATPFSEVHFTADEMFTLDSVLGPAYSGMTVDSTGVFLVNQLERLDRRENPPLYSTSWSRDVTLRTDVSLGDDLASWTNTNYASPGGVTPSGVNWISGNSNAIPGPAVDLGKTAQPLYPWGQELSWSVFELAKSALLGTPIEMSKYNAMDMKYQMDIDQVVYTGETAFSQYGLLNSPSVTATNVVNGGTASPLWSSKTAQERLNDVNTMLNAVWVASGWKVMPSRILLPPAQFLGLNSTIVTTAGTSSVLTFLRENNASNLINNRPLEIFPCKWLVGRGAGATDRMIAYDPSPEYVRYPLVPRMKTPLEIRSLFQLTTYYAKLGFVEFHYPETLAYADGI